MEDLRGRRVGAREREARGEARLRGTSDCVELVGCDMGNLPVRRDGEALWVCNATAAATTTTTAAAAAHMPRRVMAWLVRRAREPDPSPFQLFNRVVVAYSCSCE